jgi:hypothetical protein
MTNTDFLATILLRYIKKNFNIMPTETSQEEGYEYMKYEHNIKNNVFCSFTDVLGVYTTYEKVEKDWKCDEDKFYIEVGELKFELHIVRDCNQHKQFTHLHINLL